MKYLYYIRDNNICSDSLDGIKEIGIRIFAIPNDFANPTENYFLEIKEGDGPYQSIRNLRRNSPIFKRLSSKSSKLANKILDKKNISFIKDLVLTPQERTYTKDFIKLIDHTLRGHIKDKKVFGVHYFEETKMKLKELIKSENEKGVWKAKIVFFDKSNNTWIEKTSTFFPKNWSIHQLFHECDYAFTNKIKDKSSDSKFTSKTYSGINVEIIIINDNVKSIYPLYEY